MSPEIVGSLIGFVVLAIPFWKILDRTGISKAWIIVLVLPIPGLFILWLVLALSQWRTTNDGAAHGA